MLVLGHVPALGVALETAPQLVQIEALLSVSAFVVRILILLLL